MRIIINLDASSSDVFNELKGVASVGAFAALCVKAHLEFLKGKINDEENQSIRTDEVHS